MLDHRDYVGGNFDEIGKWQFDFLTETLGITPATKFLDIACGSLRLGKHIIPYLNADCYYGIEAVEEILEKGIQHELDDTNKNKNPSYCVNDLFDFSFCPGYDVAWANSLFSHLTIKDITLCFNQLKTISTPKSVFYFTFFETSNNTQEQNNPETSHARKDFYYTYQTIVNTAKSTGWEISKVEGKSSHPRRQQIIKATLI